MKFLKLFENYEELEYEELDDDSMGDEFTNFLIANDLYDKFIYNIKTFPSEEFLFDFSTIEKYYDDIEEGEEFLNFDWEITPEGDKFWKSVYYQWRKVIYNKNQNKEDNPKYFENVDFDDFDYEESPPQM